MTIRQDNYDPHLINAIASGKSVAQSAQEAHISERTAYRRLLDPEIQRQVKERRATMTEFAVDSLSRSMTPACETLNSLLRSDSDKVKLQAAQSIIDRMTRLQNAHHQETPGQQFQTSFDSYLDPDGNGFWPPSVEEGPPSVVGLEQHDALRHWANWLTIRALDEELNEEQIQLMKRDAARLRQTAQAIESGSSAGEAEAEVECQVKNEN